MEVSKAAISRMRSGHNTTTTPPFPQQEHTVEHFLNGSSASSRLDAQKRFGMRDGVGANV